MSVRNQNLIVICLDGVGAGWLGPYGNTWCETPAWNRIASESLLFDFAYAGGPQLAASYKEYWQEALPDLAAIRQASLISDDPEVCELAGAESFAERILLKPDLVQTAAVSIEQTQVAQTLAAAANWLAEAGEQPFLLWLHCRTLYGPWDAPYALRCLTSDEDDPDPPEFIEPPVQLLPSDYDPDELLCYLQAHSGQIAAMDLALDAFAEAIRGLPATQNAVIAFTSPRGYALGEHGRIGGEESLYGELLQVPCLIQFPQQQWAAQRSDRILPADGLLEIMQAWLNAEQQETFVERLGVGGALSDRQQVAVCQHADRLAIRTPGWFLSESDGGEHHLYSKPDDRWEANQVADRCPDAVKELAELLASYRATDDKRQWSPALSELLRHGYQ